MASLLIALIVISSAAMFSCEAAKAGAGALQWKSKMVNETITAEAVLDFIIKNYDDSGDLVGSVRIGLFGEKVPMTVLNFVSLCNGVKRPQGELKYAGTVCHRLIPDMHFQCGDVSGNEGSGGISIYGDTFNDENFEIGHSERGTISMSNRGANTNGSQFFIIFRSMQNLDGRHVAFGQVIDKASLDFLDKINNVPADLVSYTPKRTIKLADCSSTTLKKPLIITRRAAVQDDKFE